MFPVLPAVDRSRRASRHAACALHTRRPHQQRDWAGQCQLRQGACLHCVLLACVPVVSRTHGMLPLDPCRSMTSARSLTTAPTRTAAAGTRVPTPMRRLQSRPAMCSRSAHKHVHGSRRLVVQLRGRSVCCGSCLAVRPLHRTRSTHSRAQVPANSALPAVGTSGYVSIANSTNPTAAVRLRNQALNAIKCTLTRVYGSYVADSGEPLETFTAHCLLSFCCSCPPHFWLSFP